MCRFLNGCRVDVLQDVTSPSLLSSLTSFQSGPDDWAEGQIWLSHLDEYVDESLMDSAQLFCLCV